MLLAVFWYVVVFTVFGIMGAGVYRVLRIWINTTRYQELFFMISRFLALLLFVLLIYSFSFWLRIDWHVLFWIFLFLGLGIGVYFIYKDPKAIRVNKRLEFFLFGLFVILTVIRGFNPEIFSTEKPMDYMFIATILKQKFFPIENPWMSGVVLNYYYFGHYIGAVLLKFLNISPYIGYNLLISLWAVLAFALVFVFIRLLSTRVSFSQALIGALVIMFGGNLVILPYLLCALPGVSAWVNWDVLGLTNCSFYYPNSTRFIPFTIHEFPAYSIWLGDLHGHYWDLPVAIVVLILVFLWWKGLGRMRNTRHVKSMGVGMSLLLGAILGLSFMINPWDILAFAFVLMFLGLLYIGFGRGDSKEAATGGLRGGMTRLGHMLNHALLVALGFLLTSLPFWLTFITPGDGFGIKITWDWKYYPLVWGHAILLGILIVSLWIRRKITWNGRNVYGVVLVLVGVALVLLTQGLYLKDIFYKSNASYYRANTVFKIYFIAWSLILIPIITWILAYFNDLKIHQRILVAGIFSFMLVYSVVTVNQRFIKSSMEPIKKRITQIFTQDYLNGLLAYKSYGYPNEILEYVPPRLKRSEYYIESVTYKSYSANVPFCTYSGGICYLGWPMHLYQWHAGYTGLGVKYKGKVLSTRVTDTIKVDILARKEQIDKLMSEDIDQACKTLITQFPQYVLIKYVNPHDTLTSATVPTDRVVTQVGMCDITQIGGVYEIRVVHR